MRVQASQTYPWYLKPFFWMQQRKYKQVLTSSLVWAKIPRSFFALSLFNSVLERKSSPLDPILRSLIQVRVSQINGCAFCVDMNSFFLLERKGGLEKLEAIKDWKASTLFTEKEKIAFNYAEAMTISGTEVTDEIYDQLSAHYSEEEIVELTTLIAFQNMTSKFNAALDIPAQGFCEIRK